MSKTEMLGHDGYFAKDPEKDKGVFCYRARGETTKTKRTYDSIEMVAVYKDEKRGWCADGRGLGKGELARKRCVQACKFPPHMMPEVIRALNRLHKEISGDSVYEADQTISEEFDEVGEMIRSMGWKDRGR